MEDLYAEIKSIQCWLRDHPHIEFEARWHFITKLNELNDKLNKHIKESETNTKIS
ncbi:hypothetical protein FM120_11220 [Sphingobacterium faecium PCAi_F2.5]|nr:hypothetical protein FM120_11220 [Sphingobacterium faecium PCAi_F2.5]